MFGFFVKANGFVNLHGGKFRPQSDLEEGQDMDLNHNQEPLNDEGDPMNWDEA